MILRPLVCLALTVGTVPRALAAPPSEEATPSTWRTYYQSAARNVKTGDKDTALADYHLADQHYDGPPEGEELIEIIFRIISYEHDLYLQDHDPERLCRARDRLTRYYDSLPEKVAQQRKSGFRADEQKIDRAFKKSAHTCSPRDPVPQPPAASPSSASEPQSMVRDDTGADEMDAPAATSSDSTPSATLETTEKSKSPTSVDTPSEARSKRGRGVVIGGAVSLSAGAGFLVMMIAGATLTSNYFNNPATRLECMKDYEGYWDDGCITKSQLYVNRNKVLMTVGGLLAGAGIAAGATLLSVGLRVRRGHIAVSPQLHQPGAVVRFAF